MMGSEEGDGDKIDPYGPKNGSSCAFRDSWDDSAFYCRSAKRSSDEENSRDNFRGIRVVVPLTGDPKKD